MSSPRRADRAEPGDAGATDAEIAVARRDVERVIARLRAMGVEVAAATDQPEQEQVATSGSTAARELQQRERDAEVAHAAAIAAELEAARRRAGRVFGRQAAKRVDALELAERLARERATPMPPPVVAPAGPGVVDLEDLEHALADLRAADDHLADLLAPADPKVHRRSRPWRPVTLP